MPEEEWDYDEALFERYGMMLTQIVTLLYREAFYLTAGSRIDSRDLVHGFIVDRLLKGPFPAERVEKVRPFLRRGLYFYFLDLLKKAKKSPEARSDLLEAEGLAPVVPSEAGNVEARVAFWQVVNDPRFPRECAEVIRLRFDPRTFDVIATWETIAPQCRKRPGDEGSDEPGCDASTARRRCDRGIEIVREVLMNDSWNGDEGSGTGSEAGEAGR